MFSQMNKKRNLNISFDCLFVVVVDVFAGSTQCSFDVVFVHKTSFSFCILISFQPVYLQLRLYITAVLFRYIFHLIFDVFLYFHAFFPVRFNLCEFVVIWPCLASLFYFVFVSECLTLFCEL